MNWKPFETDEADLRMAERLRDFIPQKIFDAHTHPHIIEALPSRRGDGTVFRDIPGTYEQYCQDMSVYFSHVSHIGMNMIPMPEEAFNDRSNGMRDAVHDFIQTQVLAHPGCIGEAYVLLDDTAEDLLALLSRPGFHGLKCYCYATGRKDVHSLAIGDFLPEAAWIAADKSGCPITLHMMRPDALSDPENLAYILQKVRQYPHVPLILAHCGTAFAGWTCLEAAKLLGQFPNVWFDLAAICEAPAMFACIRSTQAKRVLWGSDYPMNMYRGKWVSFGDGFFLLRHDVLKDLPVTTGAPCLMAGENLFALRQAALMLDLDRTQIEDIFYNNAMELFGPGMRR